MQLQIKNLHGDTFTIECDGDVTVRVLKDKIAARDDLREKYDPELLKLLCSGKVMDDDDTVETYTIKPDGFLVLVKQTPGKPKPPPKKKPNQGFNNPMGGFGSNSFMQPFQQNAFGHQPFQQNPFGQHSFQQNPFGQYSFPQNPVGQHSFEANPSGQQSFEANPSVQQPHIPATGTTSSLADTSPESFSTAEDREEALATLLAMGFERSQSEKALRASFYNVETAIEYITSGNIPTVPEGTGLPKPTVGLTGQGNQPSPPAVRRQAGGGMGANLQQMRQMVQDNPAQLQVLKQAIQAEHPEIAQMIDQNPQAFIDLLNQAGASEDDRPATGAGGVGGTGGVGSAGGATGQGQGTITVTLSPHEQQIIDRLQDMGFDRNRAIEAFLACDRNENLAANYLLSAFD